MKYFTYPMKTMRITQSYKGTTSHKLHWYHGSPKDYPIDEAGCGTGRSAVYAPVDMVVIKIAGVGNSATNTIWLATTEKVNTPKKNNTIVSMTVTHWNDSDSAIKKHNKVGSIIKKGDIICYEGTDGASANHVHLTFHYGTSNNWKKNSNGYWVNVGGDSKYPETVCYVNSNFTKISSANGISFVKKSIKRINSRVGVVLRKSIGTAAAKVLTIPYNDEVIITKNNAGSKNGYTWSKVSYSTGAKTYTGYVASKYLSN